jgi:hypothetical protein
MAILDKPDWKQYHIDPWWITHRDLYYTNEPFNDSDSLKKWQQLGFTQTRFTGDMYDMRHREPKWVTPFRDYFLWKHFSWSVYRMGPGCVLPNHSDTFARFRNLHKITDTHSIRRAVVFLEDWNSGHYFEIDGNPLVKWRAGDVVVWKFDTPHLAANMGETNRYTLQITGTVNENTQF